MRRIPRRRRDIGGHRERVRTGRLRILIGEVVHQLLDAHGIGRRQVAAHEEPAHVAVRGAVHVDREGGKRVVARVEEAVLVDAAVFLGVPRLAAPADIHDSGAGVAELRGSRSGGDDRSRLVRVPPVRFLDREPIRECRIQAVFRSGLIARHRRRARLNRDILGLGRRGLEREVLPDRTAGGDPHAGGTHCAVADEGGSQRIGAGRKARQLVPTRSIGERGAGSADDEHLRIGDRCACLVSHIAGDGSVPHRTGPRPEEHECHCRHDRQHPRMYDSHCSLPVSRHGPGGIA